MNLLRKLQADRQSAKVEGNAIAAEAEKAGGYTDEQLAKLDEIQANIESIDKGIAAEQRRMAWELDAPAVDDEEETPAAGAPKNKDGKGPFANLSDFLTAVRTAAYAKEKGKPVDPRLHEPEAAIHGASETVGQDGGFLVQKDLSNDLLESMFDQSNLLSQTRKFGVGANSNGIKFNVVDETSRATGSRWGGIQVYWLAEGGQKQASKPKVKPLEMQLQKIAGLLVATDELLQDSTSYSQFAREAFAEEMAFMVDDAIVRGTGVGMPLGILNSGALVSVAAEGGQSADTVVAENIWNMFSRMPARSLKTAQWFLNVALVPQLAQLQLAVGVGGVPLYVPTGGLSEAPFGTLLGRPINFIEQASAPGDVGDIGFYDLKEYLTISKGDIQEASSIHVYFDTDETAFRWVWRINGQPRWTSAVTPYKGTPTVSPFVSLAAR